MNAVRIAHDYWITMRPYLCFVSGSAALAGIAIASPASPLREVAAFAALFFSYGLGQALTDVFQLDTDTISSPYRPLVRGTLSRTTVLAVSATGLAGMSIVLGLLNPLTPTLVVLGAAGLVTYTWFKRRFWAGPAWNAWIMALVPAMGFLAVSRDPRESLGLLALLAAVTFTSYAVFVLLGYFKDIEADRATGYITLPVRYGRRVSIWVSAAFGLGTVAALCALLAHTTPPPAAAATVAAGLVVSGLFFLGRAHVRMWSVRSDAAAHPAIGDTVRAFVLVHLGLAVWLQPGLMIAALVLAALFEMALAARPERSQI